VIVVFSFAELFIRTAYNLLLERVPNPPEAERPKLCHKDFQLIEYWYKHQWVSLSGDRVTDLSGKAENENEDEEIEMDVEGETGEELRSISPAPGAQRGQGRSRAGINVSMRYIQEKDGQVINGHRARDIRNHARAIFVGFTMQGKRFLSWGDVDAVSRRTFYNEMVLRFEELQYCDLDWKAEQIAIDTYPGWKATWQKKQKKLEQQQGKKRARRASSVEGSDTKRPKDTVEPSILSDPLLETSQVALVGLRLYHLLNQSSLINVILQQPLPTVNVIPNTPGRPPPPVAVPVCPFRVILTSLNF
jgi:hypothetical protein